MKNRKITLLLILAALFWILTVSAAAADTSGTCGDNITWEIDSDGVLHITGTGEMTSHPWNVGKPWEVIDGQITSIEISEGVTRICDSAFSSCENATQITIPESVTYIATQAFSGCRSLQSIDLPDDLTIITGGLFSGCSSLESIYIPETVWKLGGSAFSGCTALKEINIPDGITDIPSHAFSNCSALEHIDLPDSVERIWERAFHNCAGLKEIVIPEGVYIYAYAFTGAGVEQVDLNDDLVLVLDTTFANCKNLKEIQIPDTVVHIYDCAFSGCSSLEKVVIGDKVKQIDSDAFGHCSSLKEVHMGAALESLYSHAFGYCGNIEKVYVKDLAKWCDIYFYNDGSNPLNAGGDLYVDNQRVEDLVIPEGVSAIKAHCFRGCSSITTVTIPEGIAYVGMGAFQSCENLTAVAWPLSLSYVFQQAFTGCDSITDIYYAGTEEQWNAIEFEGAGAKPENCTVHFNTGALPEILEGTCGDNVVWDLDASGVLTISGTGAMAGDQIPWAHLKDRIKQVVVCEGVTSIADEAFSQCENLTRVTLSQSLETIGNRAFFKCVALEALEIPASVATIGYEACYGCSSLTEIHLPASAQISLNWGYFTAFAGCESLEAITVDEANPYYTSFEGVLYSKDMMTLLQIPGGISSLNVPEGVETIGAFAAGGAVGLKTISFPDSLVDIGFHGFAYSGLERVTIPETVPLVKQFAFLGCEKLRQVTIPGTIECIDQNGFGADGRDCVPLTVYFCSAPPTMFPIMSHAFEDRETVVYYPNGAGWTEADTNQAGENVSFCSYVAPFYDVPVGRFYSKSIPWAFKNGITMGVNATTFEPEAACTRGQVVTFLWRAMGKPKPSIDSSAFVDVNPKAYYYKAMLWAVEQGITVGVDASHFAPDETVTRGQFVTFLWRAMGKPESAGENPFADVGERRFYRDAVIWAAETGVTSGTSANVFQPEGPCTRGQVVTFLYRAVGR